MLHLDFIRIKREHVPHILSFLSHFPHQHDETDKENNVRHINKNLAPPREIFFPLLTTKQRSENLNDMTVYHIFSKKIFAKQSPLSIIRPRYDSSLKSKNQMN